MEDPGALDGVGNGGIVLLNDKSRHPSIKESGNIGDEIVSNFDSYFDEMADCLTISSMVCDTVIKGMANDIMEEVFEKIALKVKEMESLNKKLQFCESGVDEIDGLRLSRMGNAPSRRKLVQYSSFPCIAASDGMENHLDKLRIVAEEQFQRLTTEIENVKESKWVKVDKSLKMLKNTLKTVFEQVDDIIYLSKASLHDWQQEREFQEEIEVMVIQNSVRSLQEESEAKLWLQNAQVCDRQNINQLTKISEISSLRQELDAIAKMFSGPEVGQLSSHEFLHKGLTNYIRLPASLQEESLKHEEPKRTMPCTMDSEKLKLMSKDDLINEMIKMKRDHESRLQEEIEKYYKLRREFLNERDSSSHLKKDKEFDALRKKISEIILKLDIIFKETKEQPMVCEDLKNLQVLKDRLDSLLFENHQLKDFLRNERKQVKCLSSQVSGAADKISCHSLTKEKLLMHIKKLECNIEDLEMRVFVKEDVNKCILKELFRKIRCDIEDTDIMTKFTQEICGLIFKESFKDAEAATEWSIEDSDMEHIFMQEICEIIFREAVKDAEATINSMKMRSLQENERVISLEATVLGIKKALTLNLEEKEQMKKEILSLSALVTDKEKLATKTESTLMEVQGQYDQVFQELNRLRDEVSHKERLISNSNIESNTMKKKLKEALEQLDLYREEIEKLDQNLKLEIKKLGAADEERSILHATIKENQDVIAMVKTKEREHKKQMEYIIMSIEAISRSIADFEREVAEAVKRNNLRLDDLNSQCRPLVQGANSLRRIGLMYEQRLERRCSDLQMAEAEVDLLGDQVDALLSLLEKIYIALDHYAPVLQHYTGIMEILKLVRRELRGETIPV
ncbi:PREDICTED: WPP domain-associated protein [Nelumbo nucifera]|uniref:WPP domain-associated protein n=2 Tax=Nelumbo nucifera TaxID=4432 RepID=A0A1U7Z3K5_NELNU|nr:PREDICTED: WPP domain-associated protein [Nelumbo nucifera]XP_010247767.1 PREDICTED: WPP domain-associated protein [Nelumbo nucifera]DAD37189.1 TPA_asm: hypothetical protein HUJ06_007830 [Nelumbo nucifera]